MMGYKTIRFERNLLYDQVWEKPMIVLALEYGLSDVGLRKICRRLNIPLPPQGYHLRKYKGMKFPLPPAKNGILQYEAHLYQPEQSEAKVSSVAVLIPEISFEEQPENRIIASDQLNSPHPLIAEAKRELKKANPNSYGRVSTHRNSGCDISVFPGSVDRSLRIMNAFIISLIKRALQMKDERARRQREEEERRERERQRWEREIQMRKEQERIDFLLKQCASWHESQRLRAFINATRDKFSTTDPESELAQWLIWASLQADRLDPLNGVTFQVY